MKEIYVVIKNLLVLQEQGCFFVFFIYLFIFSEKHRKEFPVKLREVEAGRVAERWLVFCTWTSGQSSRHTATSTSPPLTLTPTLSLLSPSSCTPFVYTPPPTPPTMTLFLSLRPPFHVAALTIAANYQAALPPIATAGVATAPAPRGPAPFNLRCNDFVSPLPFIATVDFASSPSHPPPRRL